MYKKYIETFGVYVIGSYDPNKTNCNASEFFDLMHPNDMCMKKILKQLEQILFTKKNLTGIYGDKTWR